MEKTGDAFAIVYFDFEKNAQEMVTCLHEMGKSAAAYTGKGMSISDKKIVAENFRKEEFQFLVATEAFEVGTHNKHVTKVFLLEHRET